MATHNRSLSVVLGKHGGLWHWRVSYQDVILAESETGFTHLFDCSSEIASLLVADLSEIELEGAGPLGR